MRKLLIPAAMAIAMAVIAPSAFATDPVSVTNQNGPCDDITGAANHEVAGGCHFLIASQNDTELRGAFEESGGTPFHVSNCETEFEVRVDSNGEGFVQQFLITPGDEGCGEDLVRECTEAEAHGGGNGPWPLHAEETAEEVTTATMDICLVGSLLGRCEGPLQIEFNMVGTSTVTVVSSQMRIPCNTGLFAELAGSFDRFEEPGEEITVIHN